MGKSRASKMNGYKSMISTNKKDVYKVPKGKKSNVIIGKK